MTATACQSRVSDRPPAYVLAQCRAVLLNISGSSLYCLATTASWGSSGSAADSSACSDSSTVLNVIAAALTTTHTDTHTDRQTYIHGHRQQYRDNESQSDTVSVTTDIVTSLTKMVRRCWSKFSHVPFAITTYFTGRLCSANERVPGFVYI